MIEEGSGTPAGPLSVKTTLSRPLVLSVMGSPLRKDSVVKALVAVKGAENCCHAWVVVQVVQLLVNAPRDAPFAETFTVLVRPKIPPGLCTFPTQKDSV